MKKIRLRPDSLKVKVRRTKRYGRAVFARAQIRKGEVIAAFNGPIYDYDYEPWTKDMLSHAIQIGPRLWRDSVGLARYINHSCNPNCGIKDYVKIVAMRTIWPGEEITWDYEMTEKNPTWKMRCRCGYAECRRIIGNQKNMPKAVRLKYAGYISEWITGPR